MPTPVGPQEHEGADGAFGVFQPGARPADGLRNRLHRLFLAHDPLVQVAFHFEQAGRFLAHQPLQRDAGPHAHHFRDVFLGHGGRRGQVFPALTQLLQLAFQLELLMAQVEGVVVALGLDGFLFLALRGLQVTEGFAAG